MEETLRLEEALESARLMAANDRKRAENKLESSAKVRVSGQNNNAEMRKSMTFFFDD